MTVVLGIDAGGSHTEAVATDTDLTVLDRARGGPGWAGDLHTAVLNIHAVAERLAQHGKPAAAVIGAAGAGNPAVAAALAGALRDLADTVRVTTDLEITLAAAFGREHGIVLIAGTGSAAIARRPDGTVVRAGGMGPASGDEGSGYWLGNAALAAGLLTGMGTDRARIAALAPRVGRLAASGNAVARRLVDQAADALAGLVNSLSEGFPGDVPVAFTGGLLVHERIVRDAVVARLRSSCRFHDRKIDAAMGAARLALSR